MEQKKILVVFGTRPEAIKMAPLIKELENHSEVFCTKVVATAQHREMLDQVLKVFKIEPDYDLDIMKQNQTLSTITSNVLSGLESIYIEEKPDMILVHGDTTTSFSAALAAYYHQIAIGHVEAGLRTYDKYMPFPEEANRQLIDNLADLFFVPTVETKVNLIEERKNSASIFVTGNTAIDAVKYTSQLSFEHAIVDRMEDKYKWILLTMHRRENHGKPMENVFRAVKKIVEEHKDTAVLMPVHLSPIVQQHVTDTLGNHERILLVDPLEVDVFHKVVAKSHLILTDSGGLQEEAPALNKPVLVLRDKTERPEGVKAGTLKVVGTDSERVYDEIEGLLNNKEEYSKMAKAQNPYGDGKASQRIVNEIINFFR
jgi:UDP-N-acetylglucosamine 2-epimerase (non-hydrolysing)